MNYLQRKKLAFMSILNQVKGFVRTVVGMPPLTLPDCVDARSIIDYKIYGNSIQDESTLENIHVGERTKNLISPKLIMGDTTSICGLDLTYNDDGSFNLVGTADRTTQHFYNTNNTVNLLADTLIVGSLTYDGNKDIQIMVIGNAHTLERVVLTGSSSVDALRTSFDNQYLTLYFSNFVKGEYYELRNIRLQIEIDTNFGGTAGYEQNYEPYGYKIPIIARNESGETVTTNIYLNEPLEQGQTISYKTDKLSSLPTFKGTTIYTVGTTVQPSNMIVDYYSTVKE